MLAIEGLTKRFGDITALDHVSLGVGRGEIVGFVGSNGAGKSTTMRIAMGLLAPDDGTVTWEGRGVDSTVRRRFGYMPEERGLYPKMRIVDHVAYLGRLHGLDATTAKQRAGALLETMAVEAAPTDPVNALSLGNQQRVQLATALVHEPELLVLDEPFSGLDPVAVDVTAGVLEQRRAAGVGVLFSSHQLELVERLCERVVIIRGGRVVAAGTLDDLRDGAGPRQLDLEVAADHDWLADARAAVPGLRVVERRGDRVRVVPAAPGDDQTLLAAAARAGRVVSFGWYRPPLAEVYRDAVRAVDGAEVVA